MSKETQLITTTEAKNLTSLEIKHLEQRIKQYPAEVQGDVKDVLLYGEKAVRASILSLHYAGTAAERVRSAGVEQTWGKAVISQLAKDLGYAEGYLYALCRFGSRWTSEEIKKLMAEPMANGQMLTATHLIYVAQVDDERKGSKLLADVRRHSLSTSDTKERMLELNRSVQRSTGSPARRSGSLVGGLTKMETVCNKLVHQAKHWKAAVLAPLEDYDEGSPFTPTLLSQLKTTQKRVEEADDELTKIMGQFDKAIQKVERKLSAPSENGNGHVERPRAAKGGGKKKPAKKKSGRRAAAAAA